jgi:hypothetical protein
MVVTQHPDLNPRYAHNKDNFLGFDLAAIVDYLYDVRQNKADRAMFQQRFRRALDETLEEHRKQRQLLEEKLVVRQRVADHLNSLLGLDEQKSGGKNKSEQQESARSLGVLCFRIRPNMVEHHVDIGGWRVRFERDNKEAETLARSLSTHLDQQLSSNEFYYFIVINDDMLPQDLVKRDGIK